MGSERGGDGHPGPPRGGALNAEEDTHATQLPSGLQPDQQSCSSHLRHLGVGVSEYVLLRLTGGDAVTEPGVGASSSQEAVGSGCARTGARQREEERLRQHKEAEKDVAWKKLVRNNTCACPGRLG